VQPRVVWPETPVADGEADAIEDVVTVGFYHHLHARIRGASQQIAHARLPFGVQVCLRVLDKE